MLRVGMQMQCGADYDRMMFYGRGPHENYSDRCLSAFVSVYDGHVDDFRYDYVRPQENGNRTGVRWLCLRNAAGRGVQFIGRQPLSVAVRRCSPEALEEAGHASEAECSSDRLTVNIDLVQAGVGGTDSWSIKARRKCRTGCVKRYITTVFLSSPGRRRTVFGTVGCTDNRTMLPGNMPGSIVLSLCSCCQIAPCSRLALYWSICRE